MRTVKNKGISDFVKLPVKGLTQFLAAAVVSAHLVSTTLGYQTDYALFIVAFGLIAAGISGGISEVQNLVKDRQLAHSLVALPRQQKRSRY